MQPQHGRKRAPPQPPSSSSSSSSSPAPPPPARSPDAQLEFEDKLFKALGVVGGLGFWEAWRLPMVCRELRFGFSGGGAPADMIKLGLERRGVWAKLREARAAIRKRHGWTRLHAVCFNGEDDVQLACELAELGCPGCIEKPDGWSDTPLINACISGSADIVTALLALGANVNAAGEESKSALIRACRVGHLDVARILVASGADVNATSVGGQTPLNCARGRHGHPNPAIEALLLAAGATAGADWVSADAAALVDLGVVDGDDNE
jgi:hypothetical protein